ncbi:MAG: hypothetical protein A07HR60_01886 [uncultured archaeon A07HR60]|jgi:hypothetical protein|nr:MAG: hypothetical protein A07HR60_01886 [uncultured archaeon A07HR60]
MLLQLVDSFLLDYHVGHVLLLLLVVTTLGAIPLGSQKVIAANLMTFGLIFTVSPFGIMTQLYILLGIALIVIAPLLWTTATE